MAKEDIIGQITALAAKKFEGTKTPYELRHYGGELREVVFRLGERIEPQAMLDFFTADTQQNGGKAVFPYCRVDMQIFVIREATAKAMSGRFEKKFQIEGFERASRACVKTLLWVDTGFVGMGNYSDSPTSSDFTGFNEIVISRAESARAKRRAWFETEGETLLTGVVRKFSEARERFMPILGRDKDLFEKHGVVDLLENRVRRKP